MTYEEIFAKLQTKFGEELTIESESFGTHSIITSPTLALRVLTYLHDEPALGFQFLTDLTAAHFPEKTNEELCVVYHVYNMKTNIRIRVKTFVPQKKPDVYSATNLYSGANWMERETYDFYGINFIGHPDLTRILNVDEMDYFPLRKEFPLEDQTRKDKDDEMFGRQGLNANHNLIKK